jgi:uncharacterized protein
MKQFFPLLFFIIFIGILIAANIYLTRRFNWYFNIESTKILYAVFPPLTLLMLFGVMPLSNTTNGLGSLIYIFSAITMGVILYLLLSTILVDLVRLFTNFSPKIYGLSAIVLTAAISLGGILNSWNIQVTQQEISIKGLNTEIRAMHLTDIHIGHFRGKNFLQKIVDKTNQQNVDVVFITGDLFDGKINLTMADLAPLTQLNAPVYFVEGNHDNYSGVQTVKKYLRETGVTVLENEVTHFSELQIIGLNHLRADSETFNMGANGAGATIQNVLPTLNIFKGKPTVLLHHSPDGIKYANQHGVDLYLAGHTHAGQLFPIKYIANLLFAYNKGLHNFNGTQIFVSQGVGTFGPPMRVGTKSEIALLKLKPQ